MRLFFLILLLANLALWYWHEPALGWLQGAPQEKSVRPAAPDAPLLMLLSEREGSATAAAMAKAEPGRAPVAADRPVETIDEPAPATASVSAQTPAAAPASPAQSQASAPVADGSAGTATGSCIELGTWAELEAAEAALARVQAEGVQAELITEERQHPAGYWMLTADRYDPAGARETLRRMQEQGVEDIAIVALDSGWAISLGLYSRSSALERRRAQMLELGYTPEVRERTRTSKEFTLRLRTANGVDPRIIAERLAGEAPDLEWQTVDCQPAQD